MCLHDPLPDFHRGQAIAFYLYVIPSFAHWRYSIYAITPMAWTVETLSDSVDEGSARASYSGAGFHEKNAENTKARN